MATKTKTATRTRATTKHLDMFKGINSVVGQTGKWPTALAGAVVTAEHVAQAANLCKRNGTAKHLGLAMTLRADGATQPEINAATGDTQVNAIRDAKDLGFVKLEEVGRRNGHKVYKISLVEPKAKATRKRTAKAKAKAEQPETPAAS